MKCPGRAVKRTHGREETGVFLHTRSSLRFSATSSPECSGSLASSPPDGFTVLKPCLRDPGLARSYPPPCPTKEPTHPHPPCKLERLRSARLHSWQGEQSREQRNQCLRVEIWAQRGKCGDSVFAGGEHDRELKQEGVGGCSLKNQWSEVASGTLSLEGGQRPSPGG